MPSSFVIPRIQALFSGRQFWLFTLLLVSFSALFYWAATQRFEIRQRQMRRDRSADFTVAAAMANSATTSLDSVRPSLELLQARAETAELLRQEALAHPSGAAKFSGTHRSDDTDLDRLMKGRQPSGFPDFIKAELLENRGSETPDHALESYYWHYAGPGRMTPDESIALWWQPTEPALPGHHYEMSLGQGIGRFTGYRIVRVEEVSAEEQVFHLQREEGRTVVEEVARFIRVGKQWKRKPEVRMVKDNDQGR